MIWWVESLSPESKTLVLSTLLQSLPSYQVTEWSHRKTGRLWRWLSEVQILTRPLTLWQLMGICQPLWAPIPIRANITSEGPMRIHGAYKDPYTQQVLNKLATYQNSAQWSESAAISWKTLQAGRFIGSVLLCLSHILLRDLTGSMTSDLNSLA